MCIAIYKPAAAMFPSEDTLRTCFINNPDGAGFMYADGDKVVIRKGFMKFKSFWKSLSSVRDKMGDGFSYVLHFRITTQAGVREDCTHPFPISERMDDLRKLICTADQAVVHNGILSITTEYGARKTITYSDTMKFTTDYLSHICCVPRWWEDRHRMSLLSSLSEDSRLAILDKSGHCTLIGSWTEDGGVHYSNSSYKSHKTYSYGFGASYWKRAFPLSHSVPEPHAESDPPLETMEDWESYRDPATGLYDFYEDYCPASVDSDRSYCPKCASSGGYCGLCEKGDWKACRNESTGLYEFSEDWCPFSVNDDDSWCESCSSFELCAYTDPSQTTSQIDWSSSLWKGSKEGRHMYSETFCPLSQDKDDSWCKVCDRMVTCQRYARHESEKAEKKAQEKGNA